MKKIYNRYIAILFLLLVISSCSEDFVEVAPTGRFLEEEYYRNQSEAYNGLVAIYDAIGWQDSYVTKVGAVNSASDDHYAGGGSEKDINGFQVMTKYTVDPANGPQAQLWKKGYSGVFRANVLLTKLPDVPMDEKIKLRYAAEARFLRAYYYFDLVRFFKNIPLITTPVPALEMYDVLQASPEEVYAQIEKDLIDAIPDLPLTVPVATEGGRATQGAARALLGKVYLQREKFALAAEQFAEVNGTPGGTSKYGYKLLSKFGDLFQVGNKFNSESIFEAAYSSQSAGDWACINCSEGNTLNILVGPRGYKALVDNAPDYISGWSFLVITPELFDLIHGDPRYKYTVANLDSLEEAGAVEYEKGYMNTGYFLEKFAGRLKDKTEGGGAVELNYPQNMYEIRLADTYLLEAEALVRGSGDATRAQALLNEVRKRVGLGSTPATFENIKKERRLELVGEGHRWFDLVRWGDAPTVLASRGFVAGKHEILPIPLLELQNTKLVQNEAYR